MFVFSGHNMLAILVFLGIALFPAGSFAQEYKRVLLLNSYNQDMRWTTEVTEGVKKVLAEHEVPVKLYLEHMDTKNNSTLGYLKLLTETYAYKYAHTDFDVIIASDDNAANYVLKHRGTIFRDAPLVVCGVNDLDFHKRADFKKATGVLEFTDVEETIRSALALQPNLKRVYVVVDDTTTGRLNRAFINSVIPKFTDSLRFAWISGMPMAEVKHTVANLPPDSAVLLVNYSRDSHGVSYTYREVVKHLSQASNTPLYGMWDFFLDHGIVGGMLTSGRRQGMIAAEMAVEIIDGTAPESIPMVIHKANRLAFDYSMIQRFGLNPELIPAGADVINVPVTLYDKYALELWTISLVIIILFGAIIILLMNNRARRDAEKELEELSQYQETLIEQRTEELVYRSRELELANFELKKLDNLKTSVLNTVSHDLRTPLTSVLGFCKLISRDFRRFFKPLYEDNSDLRVRGDRIVSNLDIVEQEGERLTRLINDFLDLSKIESGDMAWTDIRVNTNKLVEQAIPVMEGYFSDSEVSFVTEVESELPEVVADPDRLMQVINNLVSNASKFTEQGSVTLNARREGGWFVVTITDTGAGIPPDKLDSIFDIFYQVPPNTTNYRSVHGSGMGLAISKRIIEHYDGVITARSILGEGATFIFRLPVA